MKEAVQTIIQMPEGERREAVKEILSSFSAQDEIFGFIEEEDELDEDLKSLLEERLERVESGKEKIFSFEAFEQIVKERYHMNK